MRLILQTLICEHFCSSCRKQLGFEDVAGRILWPGEPPYTNKMSEMIHNNEAEVVHGVYFCVDCVNKVSPYKINVEEAPITDYPETPHLGYWIGKWREEKRK